MFSFHLSHVSVSTRSHIFSSFFAYISLFSILNCDVLNAVSLKISLRYVKGFCGILNVIWILLEAGHRTIKCRVFRFPLYLIFLTPVKMFNFRWMLAYRDAMSFRASHYFVSYVSDSSSVASGFGCSRDTGHWNFQVAEPHNIEVPRSLVEVVVSWNRPLHHWLKTCKIIGSCKNVKCLVMLLKTTVGVR